MRNEIFTPINDFPAYTIGNYGTIIGARGTPLSTYANTKGYVKVALSRKNKTCNRFVHRLIAEHFIPNPSNLPTVNHIDGDKSNNTIGNLEWCSYKDNMQHATHIINKMDFLSNTPIARKLNVEQVREIKTQIPYLNTIIGTTEYYNIINTFADRYNVTTQTIKCIVWGKTWKSV